MKTLIFADRKLEEIIAAELITGPGAASCSVKWKKLIKKYKLSKSFINKYIDSIFMNTDLRWYLVATSYCLSEDFIRLYYSELRKYCFGSIFHNNNISIDFIREHVADLTADDWKSIIHNSFIMYKLHNDKELAKKFGAEFKDYLYTDIQHVISDHYAQHPEKIAAVKKYFNSVK